MCGSVERVQEVETVNIRGAMLGGLAHSIWMREEWFDVRGVGQNASLQPARCFAAPPTPTGHASLPSTPHESTRVQAQDAHFASTSMQPPMGWRRPQSRQATCPTLRVDPPRFISQR